MNESLRLYRSITYISDEYIEEAGYQKKQKPFWNRWISVAAAVFIIAAAAAVIHPSPTVNENNDFAILYNKVTEYSPDIVSGFCIYGEELSEAELAAVLPDKLENGIKVRGAAKGYYGWGELVYVVIEFQSDKWDGMVSLYLRDINAEIYSDIIIEPTKIETTRIGDSELTAYEYTDDGGTMLWAEFERDGVRYVFDNNSGLDIEEMKTAMEDVISRYADVYVDFSIFEN